MRCRKGGFSSGTTSAGAGCLTRAVDVSSFTLDAWVHDLETVVDTLGLERFPLLGISQGGPIAVTYAARHPGRVSHLDGLRDLHASHLGKSQPDRTAIDGRAG